MSTVEAYVRRSYCISGPDGRDDAERLRKAIEAVTSKGSSGELTPTDIPGVPRLRHRIDHLSQVAEAVRRFLPEVEASPRLHALSFVDPLRVANELGVAVSPAVARSVRRGLSGIVSFDLSSLDDHGDLRGGMGQIHWRPKSSRS